MWRTHCASACALIFAGGHGAVIGADDARIGVHGYALRPGNMYFGMIDPRREMARDMAIYRAQKISEPFVRKTVKTAASADVVSRPCSSLRAAGFVTVSP